MSAPILQIHEAYENTVRMLQEQENESRALGSGLPFLDVNVDLADTNLTGDGYKLPASGVELRYCLEGSSPNGRIDIIGNGSFSTLSPGQTLRAPLSGLSLKRSTISGTIGTARIIISKNSAALFKEPELSNQMRLTRSVNLLGDPTTYTTIAENTQPSLSTDGWEITGWRKIRVFIDGQAANTATSLDVTPWFGFFTAGTIRWFSDDLDTMSLPAPAATARYRVITIDLNPLVPATLVPSDVQVRMYLEIRNMLPSAQTQLGFAVQGIE